MTVALSIADKDGRKPASRTRLRSSLAKLRESIATRARALPLARHAWARYRRRRYEQRIRRFIDEKTGQADRLPMGAVYEATMRCNLHCEFCYVGDLLNIEGQWREEMTLDALRTAFPEDPGLQVSLTGGEISGRGPLARGLRYVLTANVADQSLDQDGGGPLSVRHNTTYALTGQLEYKDGTDGRRGADRVNLTVRYTGPNDTGFTRFSAYSTATATWSHAITDRLSSVLTIADLRLTRPREVVGSAGTILSRDVYNAANPRVILSLTWSFRPPGQGPRVQQQQQQGPPPIPGAGPN